MDAMLDSRTRHAAGSVPKVWSATGACGGHVKHHLQIALGRDVESAVRSSALSSGGKRPCAFSFRFVTDSEQGDRR